MELKPLRHYYDNLKGLLNDGDNFFIKKYTTNGFKKSYQMWNDYSHDSLESFFNDFINEYPEDYLKENCKKCHNDMLNNGSSIDYDDLFDVLLRRLVIDSYVGFKFEDKIREKLIQFGCIVHNYDVLSENMEKKMDIDYGIDIFVFNKEKITNIIQVKNTSTFVNNGEYIKLKRKEFFDKEYKANIAINDGIYRDLQFYIYDKYGFINERKFKFFVNPSTNKHCFKLNELINKDGSLKINVKHLKSREL